MKINKRIVEAALVSLFVILVVIGWQWLRGYMATKSIEADIRSRYDSVDFLQQQTSFGYSGGSGWLPVIFVAGLWVAMIAIYYFARIYIDRLIKK